MSANILKDAAEKMKNGGLVVPLTVVFFAMLVVSCALLWEDYTTSRMGYLALPTRKANDWVIPLVAMLPQLGQVGFAYVFATDIRKKWALGITLLLWTVDVITDVTFKAGGLGWFVYSIATVESIVIYSIGSELMLATSVGMLSFLLPSFFKQITRFFRMLLGVETGRASGGKNTNKPRLEPLRRPQPNNSNVKTFQQILPYKLEE